MARRNELFFVFSAFLAAILIAATNVNDEMTVHPIGRYFYWVMRIGLESALFYGAHLFLSRWEMVTTNRIGTVCLAILLSHIPFVLSVTAMDIILGLPELGMENSLMGNDGNPRLAAFAMEVMYLLDNHIALCFLTSLYYLVERYPPVLTPVTDENNNAQLVDNDAKDDDLDAAPIKTFLSSIEPALKGDILHLEAQEHYVIPYSLQNPKFMI